MSRRGLHRLGAIAALAAAPLALSIGCRPASACTLSLVGKMLVLSGEILKGDEYKFRDFLAALGNVRVASVRLNSPGGNIATSGEIGRQIRNAGLMTMVDASHDICASACTVLFASGKDRLYLHAPTDSGVMRAGLRGLGFHQGSTPDAPAAMRYNGPGTALMMSYYYEFGVPGAVDLVNRATPDAIFGVSGSSALSLGIATRVSAPGGL